MCVGMYVMVMSGKQRSHRFEKEQKILKSIKTSPFFWCTCYHVIHTTASQQQQNL